MRTSLVGLSAGPWLMLVLLLTALAEGQEADSTGRATSPMSPAR